MNRVCGTGILAGFLAMAMAGLSMAAGAAPAPESGSTAGYGWEIVWDAETARITHVATGREVGLYRDEKGKTEEEGYTNYEMLSVVGPVISYSVNWYGEGGAHPTYGMIYRTLDLSKVDPAGDKDGRVRRPNANLADLFGEEAVFRQLAANPSVRAAIRGEFSDSATATAAHADPQSLAELVAAADGGCRATMGENLLTDFAILYQLGHRTAAVGIGLSHGCEVDRGTFTELRPIYLRIPDALYDDFQKVLKTGVLKFRPFEEPGFDCNKAGTPIEYAVCTDARLAFLDKNMGIWYRVLRKRLAGQEKASLKADQRAWIEARDAGCLDADADCLRESYIGRLRDMEYPQMEIMLSK